MSLVGVEHGVLSSQFWALILAFHVYMLTARVNSHSFHSPIISSEISGSAEKADNLLSRLTSEVGHQAAAMQERERASDHQS